MKSVRCDLNGEEFDAENNVRGSFTFSTGGSFYRADIDISPKGFLDIVKLTRNKNISFGKYIKHKTEAEIAEHNGRKGHYEPAKNVVSMIASLVEQEVKQ